MESCSGFSLFKYSPENSSTAPSRSLLLIMIQNGTPLPKYEMPLPSAHFYIKLITHILHAMRKRSQRILCLLFFLFVQRPDGFSQHVNEYKRLKVIISSGTTLSTGLFPGLLLSLEPQYRISDKIALGAQLQSSVVIMLVDGDQIESFDIGTIYGTINYYLKRINRIQPFLGAGTGVAQQEYFDSQKGYGVTNDPSLLLRAGFDYRHLTSSVEYNILTYQGFLSIKLGVSIGGGKRK